jgi:hypothetical protein
MSIFTKPVSQLSTADLQDLLNDGAVENIRLEFKAEVPSKDETLKKVSSFGNTFGGYIVVGARARSTDGRIEALPGVDAQPGYKQTIVQWCFGGASPPLTAEVSDPLPSPLGEGRVCYVIYVPESDVAPHFLNARKGVYVRTDEFSSRFEARLANENELRHLLERRKIILDRRTQLLERARNRFATYLVKRAEELTSKARSTANILQLGATMTLSVIPRFPASRLAQQEHLRKCVEDSVLAWRQVGFPKPYNPTISQHESVLVLQPEAEFSLFELNVWGMLFYGTTLEMEADEGPGIHLYRLAACIMLFLEHAGRVLEILRYSGPLRIEVSLASMLGVQWLVPEVHWLTPKPGSVLDDKVNFFVETTSEALREKVDAVSMDIIRYICFSANLSEHVNNAEKLDNLIRHGYKYNFWNVPESLKV